MPKSSEWQMKRSPSWLAISCTAGDRSGKKDTVWNKNAEETRLAVKLRIKRRRKERERDGEKGTPVVFPFSKDAGTVEERAAMDWILGCTRGEGISFKNILWCVHAFTPLSVKWGKLTEYKDMDEITQKYIYTFLLSFNTEPHQKHCLRPVLLWLGEEKSSKVIIFIFFMYFQIASF